MPEFEVISQNDSPEDIEAKLYKLRSKEEGAKQKEGEARAEEEKPKMSWLFFILMLFLSAVGDLIEFFSGGTLGWVSGLFIDFILLVGVGLSKGARGQFKKILIAVVGESIPVVATLPLRTPILIWSFISSRKGTQKILTKARFATKIGAKFNPQMRALDKALKETEKISNSKVINLNSRRNAELEDKFNRRNKAA